MIKKDFERIKPVDLSADHTSLNLVNWHYKTTIKELYQIREASSLEKIQ